VLCAIDARGGAQSQAHRPHLASIFSLYAAFMHQVRHKNQEAIDALEAALQQQEHPDLDTSSYLG